MILRTINRYIDNDETYRFWEVRRWVYRLVVLLSRYKYPVGLFVRGYGQIVARRKGYPNPAIFYNFSNMPNHWYTENFVTRIKNGQI